MRVRLPRFERTTVMFTIAALALAAAYWGLVAFAESLYQTESTVPSITNERPAGVSVYFRYLTELGLGPRALRQFDVLPAGATILAIGPLEAPPTKAETKRLAAWVRSGGRLVLAGMPSGLLLDGLGLSGAPSQGATGSLVAPALPSALAAGVSRIAPGGDRLRAKAPEWVAQYADEAGSVVLSAVEGSGTVVWLAGSDALTNAGIGKADNARLAVLLAVTGRGPVYFDEYHLGFADDASVASRLGPGGQAATLLVLLAVAAMFAARGRRLGPALSARDEPTARSATYITSLAELYRKAGARAEALESLEDGLARSLARRYGTVEAGLSRRPQAREALEASRRLRAGAPPGKDEFMAAARTLRRARREVEGNG